jgi:hypothetical protein
LKAASQSVSYINRTIFLAYIDPQEVEFYKERLPLELA